MIKHVSLLLIEQKGVHMSRLDGIKLIEYYGFKKERELSITSLELVFKDWVNVFEEVNVRINFGNR